MTLVLCSSNGWMPSSSGAVAAVVSVALECATTCELPDPRLGLGHARRVEVDLHLLLVGAAGAVGDEVDRVGQDGVPLLGQARRRAAGSCRRCRSGCGSAPARARGRRGARRSRTPRPGVVSSSGRLSVIVARPRCSGARPRAAAARAGAAPCTAVRRRREAGSGSALPLPPAGGAAGGGACETGGCWARRRARRAAAAARAAAGSAGAAGGAAAAAASAISGVIASTSPVGSQRRYSPHWQKSWSDGFSRPQLWQVLILARLRPSSWPP